MFAEMPLDNRTVVKFTLPPATADFAEVFLPLERRGLRNGVIFRSERQFCNIEPKICQHG
jgi:hypothetical protein